VILNHNALHLMELNGLSPEQGPVLVNGATGGVASVAIDMLAQRGYQVTAMTGKVTETAYLKTLGATEVIGRLPPQDNPSPWKKRNGQVPLIPFPPCLCAR
jgi:NADPH:quinone reductase-like Zn-dependent oxidoreductase